MDDGKQINSAAHIKKKKKKKIGEIELADSAKC